MSNKHNVAVKISNLSKSFKLPSEKQSTLKGTIINFHKRGFEQQHVLDNISIDVMEGDFLGIIGRNGSGKSTLLKTISGIYEPNNGSISIVGKLTPFIELGVGFNHELSGRDNVYLNGALLGFSRSEVDVMYEDIVSFAELERFMDQKLKNYSSGMQVRLAFSIAIRADTDVLVLDEVLAVGDEAFQRKCYEYFNELKQKGKTVILVTHDMSAVQRFCTRAIVIDDGKVLFDGDTDTASDVYSNLNLKSTENGLLKNNKKREDRRQEGADSRILDVVTRDIKGVECALFKPNEQINVDIRIKLDESVTNPALQVWFSNPGGLAINRLAISSSALIKQKNKEFTLRWKIDGIFNDGNYSLSVEIDDEETGKIVEVIDNAGEFLIAGWDAANVLVHPDNKFEIIK